MKQQRKRILIIDDEPFILTSLTRILEDNYDVTTALGGRSALDLLDQNKNFDLIISDVSMPEVSGADLYKTIVEQHSGLEHHIIFMTGFAYTDELKNFLSSIHNKILPKPFEEEDLYQAITNFFTTND